MSLSSKELAIADVAPHERARVRAKDAAVNFFISISISKQC
jgi:hypothetical protein